MRYDLMQVLACDIRYFACPRLGVKVPVTLSGVSAYADSRLTGLPFFSCTTCALFRVKISQSSELVMEESMGFRTSVSGVGIVVSYVTSVKRVASFGEYAKRPSSNAPCREG
jgi:hypothetical protein